MASRSQKEASMPVLFRPAEETFVVTGTREAWVTRCEQALRANRAFRGVETAPTLFRVTAQYRRPPVWGELTMTLTPEGTDSTRVTARAATLPNLYTLIFSPERRIVDDFAEALR
jgi:hypothetical protein